MRPRERIQTGEQDLFRSRLDQIIYMKHPLVALGRTVDWRFLEERFGEVYTDEPGRPPLPTRLWRGWRSSSTPRHVRRGAMQALGREPYYEYFCGEEFLQHCWCSIARR